MDPMTKQVVAILVSVLIAGCAGIETIHIISRYQLNKSEKYILFPFRDPSFNEREFPGVGSRFTNRFTAVCAEYGLKIVPAFSEQFQSGKDVNISNAILYAKQSGANFIITGQITKWIDRTTEWSGKRDFAGLAIFVRAVNTGDIVFSAELEEHSNIFWSGTPDDFVGSLSKAIAAKFLEIQIVSAQGKKLQPGGIDSIQKPPTTTPIGSTQTPNIVIVTGTFANIRSGAGDEFPIVTAVRKGDKLILLGESGEWFNVRLGNRQEGWINSRFVKE
jgi:hypothetical protein